jgi:phosphatidylserine synthase
MVNTRMKGEIHGPVRAAVAAVPIAVLTIGAFYFASFLWSGTCSPEAWFCGLPQAFNTSLIVGLLGSYVMLKLFRVPRPLPTSVVASIVTLLGTLFVGEVSGLHWDAPGLMKTVTAVGWMMLVYGVTNYALTKRKRG